ncbi:hypothetical protein [uncultured Muribaculum sp.]|jgi:uncharacterized protein (DUF1919 family)|uniref:hypothetical protein n=1 Tax=uncultured Muribaculum sp. TaxID=1918613 RepID=UPI002730677A|nr:hypothetical protein [uncultured Muribaculum sp.]
MDEGLVKRFIALPTPNKIAFVAPGCTLADKSIIVIPELEMLNRQGGDETPYTIKHFDIIKYLNSL